jgi:hypothetical protein
MIEIEKNIPPPLDGPVNSKHKFHTLEVWDSFVGDAKVVNAFQQYCYHHKWKQKRQKLGDNKWRIWRVE